MKEKIDEFVYVKMKTICSLKGMKGEKRQAIDQNRSGNTLSQFATRIYKEL